MAVHDSGSQALTAGTEHVVSADPDTTAGTFVIQADLSGTSLGDTINIRLYYKIKSGGTYRLVKRWTIQHTPEEPLFHSPAFLLENFGWKVSIEKETGGAASQTVDWAILTP